ncbi:MAG: TetR/AcrR family transcriptional regulator [Hyphomonadaceae bacterium]|nr:TetR/AcrR family transcriptional regulator [Hyphomonadaceae bacterium]MBC6412044.1 TetR/AcrR family transcriptional regulator [Hyphomonadaceae bacterium]
MNLKTSTEKVKAQSGRETGRQAQKSASTRKIIVEAALSCLIRYGYANTTTPVIAREAGVSRGAMMHHFSNRLTVIQAAIEYLHEKRLKAFRRAVANLPKDQPQLHDGLKAYWKHVTHPLYVAFHELTVAARTDRDLARILGPAQEAFYDEWYRMAGELFPDWQKDPASLELAMDLVNTTLEGMAIRRLSLPENPGAEARLFKYLEACLAALKPAD